MEWTSCCLEITETASVDAPDMMYRRLATWRSRHFWGVLFCFSFLI